MEWIKSDVDELNNEANFAQEQNKMVMFMQRAAMYLRKVVEICI